MPKIEPFPVPDREVTHVIIEIFGGDNNLSKYIHQDLDEMAQGNTGPFAVLALADYAGVGGAEVIDLYRGGPRQVIESLGEIDTGDPDTLATFLARALVTYRDVPHKAIGFWDHGSGVFDEEDANETYLYRGRNLRARPLRNRNTRKRRLFVSLKRLEPTPTRLRAMLHDDTNGGVLTNYEAHGVLNAAFSRADYSGKVDLIFSDTCLNGMVEVLEQFKEFAEVIVGSEELEPGDGWEYNEWFELMSKSPPTNAQEWGKQAVEAYKSGYTGRPDMYPCTLGAFKTDNEIPEGFHDLVTAAQQTGEEGFELLVKATRKTQKFARLDTFDIKHYATNVKDLAPNPQMQSAADKIISALDNAAIHSTALGSSVQNANGLAFWFPSSPWGLNEVGETYRKLKFDEQVGWVNYLKSGYEA